MRKDRSAREQPVPGGQSAREADQGEQDDGGDDASEYRAKAIIKTGYGTHDTNASFKVKVSRKNQPCVILQVDRHSFDSG